jgi:hypothetical protein
LKTNSFGQLTLKVKQKLRKYDFEKLREKLIDVKVEHIKKVEDQINQLRGFEGRRLQEVKAPKEDEKVKYLDAECDLAEDSVLKDCQFDWDIVQSPDQEEVKLKFNFKNFQDK